MKGFQIALLIIGIVLLLLGIAYLLCYRLVKKLFTSAFGRISADAMKKNVEDFDRKMSQGPLAHRHPMILEGRRWIANFPIEEVSTRSHDGLRLVASLFERPEDDSAAKDLPAYGKTLILFHGYHSSAPHDFSCACSYYYSIGFRLLLVDQRAHGRSEGDRLTFGAKEQLDVLSWCRWTNERYGSDRDIVITGISMGATTVLLAASHPELPSNVIGVIGDCGYADAESELSHVVRDFMHLPTFPLMNILRHMCRRRAGFDLSECSAERALASIRIPAFFIHGEDDDFVPPEHTRRNAAACASRHSEHFVKGAGHGLSYLVDPPHTQQLLREFIESL